MQIINIYEKESIQHFGCDEMKTKNLVRASMAEKLGFIVNTAPALFANR